MWYTALQRAEGISKSNARVHDNSAASGISNRENYIQRHSLPLAVPAATQSSVGWNLATAGTAVMASPPSCASCCPLAVYISTKRFMLPMQNRCTPSCGNCCHWARNLCALSSACMTLKAVGWITYMVTQRPVWLLWGTTAEGFISASVRVVPLAQSADLLKSWILMVSS
jgi:hypothetical protein